jgi:hypothetical protein
VNWNSKSGHFEIALCVWPADLEKALAIDQQKSIDLDKVEDLDEMMKTYLEKRFSIRKSGSLAGKSSTKIRWVGHERDHKTAWLYFEVEGDKTATAWTIENRIFFELNEDQLNQLQLTVGKKSNIVVCRTGESRFEMDTAVDSAVEKKF